MKKRLVAAAVAAMLCTATAVQAQWVVIDPTNLVQNTLTAIRTLEYEAGIAVNAASSSARRRATSAHSAAPPASASTRAGAICRSASRRSAARRASSPRSCAATPTRRRWRRR